MCLHSLKVLHEERVHNELEMTRPMLNQCQGLLASKVVVDGQTLEQDEGLHQFKSGACRKAARKALWARCRHPS